MLIKKGGKKWLVLLLSKSALWVSWAEVLGVEPLQRIVFCEDGAESVATIGFFLVFGMDTVELGFVVRASGESTEMNVGWAIIRQSGNPDFAEDMNPVCGDGDTNLLEVVSVKPANSASLRCSVAAKYSGSCSFMGDKCKCVSDQDLAGQEWAKRQAILAHCHARDGYERVFSSIHVQSAQRPGATPPLAHEWPRARRFLRWP